MPKLCQYQNCRKRASYGYFYQMPERCKEHAEDRKPQYRICVCGKAQPTFNFPGEKRKYCVQCKKEGMVDVISKRCDCGSLATFNFPGEKRKFCSQCKKEGMENVISKKCDCGSLATFNFPGKKAKFCSQCKKEGMEDVINKKCVCGKAQPIYNFRGKKAKFCSQCKKEGMENVINKRCPNCIDWPDSQLGNKKYRGYCTRCFGKLFPLDPLTFQIRCKTKETAVRDFINANYQGFQHDRPLFTGQCNCTHRRRIDHRILIGNTLLAIETDENQHKSYEQMDEEARYNDLFMAYSGKWVYIRFNPDIYRSKKGKRKNPTISTRLYRLKEEIDKQIKRIKNGENTELVERVYLYYDNF